LIQEKATINWRSQDKRGNSSGKGRDPRRRLVKREIKQKRVWSREGLRRDGGGKKLFLQSHRWERQNLTAKRHAKGD